MTGSYTAATIHLVHLAAIYHCKDAAYPSVLIKAAA